MEYSPKVMEFAKTVSTGCQGDLDAYCVTACPMHTDAMGYVRLIRDGKLEESLLLIREKLFLPGVLGRICSHPCETNCRRNIDYNQPIAIASLKRYAADKVDNERLWDCSVKPSTGKKVAIIGAGPAGAEASIHLAREGHSVTIFEKLPVVGGMMRVGIPSYRLPRNIIDFEYKYLEKLGVEIKLNTTIGKDISFDKLKQDFDAIIVANGASKGSLPQVKGINSTGVITAVDFLKEVSLTNKSTKIGKNIVVVGGGDVAMDCARSAIRLGVDSVNLVYRRTIEEMPSSLEEIEHTQEEDITFNCNLNIQEIIQENSRVNKINCVKTETVISNSGEKQLIDTTKTISLNCDTVIYATGQLVDDISNGEIIQKKNSLYDCDANTLQTNNSKVFVAGDCAGSSIVVEAMALGKKAALSVIRFLENIDCSSNRDFTNEYGFTSELDIPTIENKNKRNKTKMISIKERVSTFDECDLGFDDETALLESSRCMQCECKLCMQECIMFNDFVNSPKDFATELVNTGNLSDLMTYSCNMCDQCTIVCPKDYKFADFFGAARKDKCKANNGNSPIKGHSAIIMHQLLGFSSVFCTKKKGKGK